MGSAEAVFFDHDCAAFASDEFRIYHFKASSGTTPGKPALIASQGPAKRQSQAAALSGGAARALRVHAASRRARCACGTARLPRPKPRPPPTPTSQVKRCPRAKPHDWCVPAAERAPPPAAWRARGGARGPAGAESPARAASPPPARSRVHAKPPHPPRTCCPFAHLGEKAKRRDPLRFRYSGTGAGEGVLCEGCSRSARLAGCDLAAAGGPPCRCCSRKQNGRVGARARLPLPILCGAHHAHLAATHPLLTRPTRSDPNARSLPRVPQGARPRGRVHGGRGPPPCPPPARTRARAAAPSREPGP
jgi:hypothetical protein